jgi:hypothetical protein
MDALANIVTIVHLAYFVFVVGGFMVIVGRRSRWVFNPWFRIAHLLSVWIVLAEDVIGVNCPLNVAESSLRAPETGGVEASSGFGYILDQLLHHTISERMLDVLYWTLGLASVLLLFLVPPRFRKASSRTTLATDA